MNVYYGQEIEFYFNVIRGGISVFASSVSVLIKEKIPNLTLREDQLNIDTLLVCIDNKLITPGNSFRDCKSDNVYKVMPISPSPHSLNNGFQLSCTRGKRCYSNCFEAFYLCTFIPSAGYFIHVIHVQLFVY